VSCGGAHPSCGNSFFSFKGCNDAGLDQFTEEQIKIYAVLQNAVFVAKLPNCIFED
jgi:hypothetical protein